MLRAAVIISNVQHQRQQTYLFLSRAETSNFHHLSLVKQVDFEYKARLVKTEGNHLLVVVVNNPAKKSRFHGRIVGHHNLPLLI